MKALAALRKFIIVNSDTENQHEIRLYIQDNVHELARDFCVTTDTITNALANVPQKAVRRSRHHHRAQEEVHPERFATNFQRRCPCR
jgi:hypothetical protein